MSLNGNGKENNVHFCCPVELKRNKSWSVQYKGGLSGNAKFVLRVKTTNLNSRNILVSSKHLLLCLYWSKTETKIVGGLRQVFKYTGLRQRTLIFISIILNKEAEMRVVFIVKFSVLYLTGWSTVWWVKEIKLNYYINVFTWSRCILSSKLTKTTGAKVQEH